MITLLIIFKIFKMIITIYTCYSLSKCILLNNSCSYWNQITSLYLFYFKNVVFNLLL